MMNDTVIAQLKDIVGEANVLTDKADLVTYSYDATADLPSRMPDVIVLPATTAEVRHIVLIAKKNKLAVYPRGAGTNLSGGTIPLQRGIVLSFQRMDRILEVDPENLTATVQAGVVIQALNDAVAPYGLMYPPDPGTVTTATMGGSVAECAGGLRGLKYGVTKHYVLGMEVVLASGEVFRFGGKTVKNVTAYDFASLFVGSEGTLGIITQITVKLVPPPQYRKAMLATFQRLEDAGNTVTGIIKAHIIPATLEIMDRVTIQTVENYAKVGLPTDAEALLLIEVDGGSQDLVDAEAEAVLKVIVEHGGKVRLAQSEVERDRIWTARRAALPALAQVSPTTILEDATVPRNRIADMLVAVQDIARRYRLRIGTFGHAGDGNLHPTILTDVRNAEEMERVHRAVDEIFATALRLGGTLSGEHGIGLAKMKYLGDELNGSGLNLMRCLKDALDPDSILNPAKMVPLKRSL
ncbi:MAG: glycolate oxidase subunit GlcD [Deltaproteobacteria bacterium HGW-Deltaproteobacteria-19]|jgi:glycolate oxidase|nr:MAG: glycolate oxidase subunit GlcD [Deltaproteobacteria bacterium HGW-Deltaproteobacteria-19]